MKKPVRPQWDDFDSRNLPSETNTYTRIPGSILFGRYATCAVCFVVILSGTVTTKTTFLILANSVSNENIETEAKSIFKTKCYLLLLLSTIFPDVNSLISVVFRGLVKNESENKKPGKDSVIFTVALEAIQCIGEVIMSIGIMPHLDGIIAIIIPMFYSIVPLVIQFLFAKKLSVKFFATFLLMLLQVTGLILMTWFLSYSGQTNNAFYNPLNSVITTICIVCISIKYFENHIGHLGITVFGKPHSGKSNGNAVTILISVTRIWIAVISVVVIMKLQLRDSQILDILKCFFSSTDQLGSNDHQFYDALVTMFLMNILTPLAVSYCSHVACRCLMQVQAFVFPIFLSSLVLLIFSSLFANSKKYDTGINLVTLFDHSFDISNSNSTVQIFDWNFDKSLEGFNSIYITICGLLFAWIPFVISSKRLFCKQSRNSAHGKIFVQSSQCGNSVAETLILNRSFPNNKVDKLAENFNHEKPTIFVCATMWHETIQEMTQLMTSLIRLDRDQKLNRDSFKRFYDFQVHILFDDAWEENLFGKRPNIFVHQLIQALPIAVQNVYQERNTYFFNGNYSKTPYGAKLVYTLPCGNPLVIHLKDKTKIRTKKRWSQCMYLYYILGFMNRQQQKIDANNTYLLALDGDIDFEPLAVRLLLDRMIRNPDVGAACGRIHPIGTGPVVWFQKFEYAVGHWLQKTAEHVLGCVLCSPGCFSLFRATALMDSKVINTYASVPREALHYIQWNQGEDRWLCTLLLKQGWKIEYCAASNSYTYAPESFNEFFNQRKRWGPSTMANIFDIVSTKNVSQNNPYISGLYIIYQKALLGSSLLGPGTVILMTQGSFIYLFRWTATNALILSVLPVIIYSILCLYLNTKTQISVALIMTIVYSIVMMYVVTSLIGDGLSTSILNPTSLFMVSIIAIYSFTGVIHPNEMSCLLYGLLYFLAVPAAFILLPIYTYGNMHNISWGTRENAKNVKTDQSPQKAVLDWISKLRINNLFLKNKFSTLSAITDTKNSQDLEITSSTETLPSETSSMCELGDNKSEVSSVDIKQQRVKPNSKLSEFPGIQMKTKLEKLETKFWRQLIATYLEPTSLDPVEQSKIANDLQEFRNKSYGGFLLINTLWIALVFSLTMVTDVVHIPFVFDGITIKTNPITFAFLAFFMLVITIQFVSMLFHRWKTFLQLISTVTFGCRRRKKKTQPVLYDNEAFVLDV